MLLYLRCFWYIISCSKHVWTSVAWKKTFYRQIKINSKNIGTCNNICSTNTINSIWFFFCFSHLFLFFYYYLFHVVIAEAVIGRHTLLTAVQTENPIETEINCFLNKEIQQQLFTKFFRNRILWHLDPWKATQKK